MGKSTPTCFKIISCAGDSVDREDPQTTQNKGLSDRRGWSFRKKSSRHRILSNSVASGSPSSVNKETPESTVIDLQVQPDLSVPEKTSVVHETEDTHVSSTQLDLKSSATEATKEDDRGANAIIDESSIIIIQTAVRGSMARRVLLKQKSATKMQAAVRGHLVRRHAIGTLRCVQAIIKMQALVRARLAINSEKQIEGKGKRAAKPTMYQYVSIEKLLSNAFARQLMETTPRNEPINIKCQPLQSDSAWKWLERWMAISSTTKEEAEESVSIAESSSDSDNNERISIPSDHQTYSANVDDPTAAVVVSAEASEKDDKSIDCDATGARPNHVELHDIDQSNPRGIDLIEEFEVKPDLPQEEETNESLETEAKKLSRKASNPAFLAAQSKFEELSSTATLTKLTMSSSSKSMDNERISNTVSNTSAIPVVGSECGTELSISSALDSPERPVAKVHDFEQESSDKAEPTILEMDPSYSNSNILEQDGSIDLFNSTVAVESPRTEKKDHKDDLQVASDPVHKSSPEASPRSHITASESQATPSSRVSTKPKKSKGEKSDKTKLSSSTGKKSISSLNRDSDPRGSVERLHEHKTGKTSSFGSAKPDHSEQELRNSNSNNSRPSYMQATESARAKAIMSGSPRLSPDVVHEKDMHMKKRHSLPGSTERQGSPRIQRSLSQQNAKGNDTQSPQERRWRR